MDIPYFAILILAQNLNIEKWYKGAEKLKDNMSSAIFDKNFKIFFSHRPREGNKSKDLRPIVKKNVQLWMTITL